MKNRKQVANNGFYLGGYKPLPPPVFKEVKLTRSSNKKENWSKFLLLGSTAGTIGVFLLTAAVNAQETTPVDGVDVTDANLKTSTPPSSNLETNKSQDIDTSLTDSINTVNPLSTLTTDTQPLPTNNQPQTTNTQQLTTDTQQLPTNNQPQTTNTQQSTTDTQPLPTNNQPPTTNNQPLTNNQFALPAPLEVKILTPSTGTLLDNPATTVILQFIGKNPQTGAVQQAEIRVNGVLVDSSLIGRSEVDSSNNLVTQTWYGVPLNRGKNIITAQISGSKENISTIKIQVSDFPTQIRISTVESRIPANGRSTATIQGELLDKNGNRSHYDGVITLSSSDGEIIGADYEQDSDGFQVLAKQGQFRATLRSGLEAKTAYIRATNLALNLEGFTKIQFETNLRPSLVTGVVNFRIGARGTDYYKSFREFLPPDGKNGTQVDVNGAIFATGKIGEWLFTGAYNSDRALNKACNGTTGLFQNPQFCEQGYPVYGDSSTSSRVAPSIDSVYVRIEKSAKIPGADPDYFMWGDYNTSELATRSQQFTSTTLQLHGFKANYNFGNLQVTGFYANNVQGFQRDTIPPDGTSGYYFLSRRLLISGSENIFIEEEELNRPGTVIDRKQLTRGLDYDIDYDRGTVLFRKPILRTDLNAEGQVLVRRIVVTYQYESRDSDNSVYGGRVRYHFSRKANNESWLGATYLHQTQGIHSFELYGADALISIGSKAQLIAEYAHSKNTSDYLGFAEGSAYRVEASGEIAKGINAQAYYRAADPGFANNATVSFVPGQTRYGAQATARISQTTNLKFQYDHEDNYGIAPRPLDTFEDLFNQRTNAVPGSQVDNSLTTISAGIQQLFGKSSVELDFIHRDRTDRLPLNPLSSSSNQLRTRVQLPLSSKLVFQAQNETTISATKDTVYSDRTIVGLNWALLPGINLNLAHQLFHSGPLEGNGITSLNLTGDYKLGSDTTITGRYSILGGANGLTNQGAIGLNQRWHIASGLRLDLAYEHIFGNYLTNTAAGTQFFQPFATGQSASALGLQSGDNYSIGLEYSDNPAFQASARYEHRTSSQGSNTVISAAATGKITPALTALFRYQKANAANQTLVGLGSTANLKLGLAYRDPNSDKFNALLRYEYRKNPAIIPDTILFGSGTGSTDHTLALETIYAPNWQWELYGKYAMRHSTSYLAQDLVNTGTVSLAQLRATYRLGYSMDLVGEARWINQPATGYSETGFVVEAGYYLTPNLRAAVGYSGGNVIDRDFDNSRSAGGAYASLTVKVNELFKGFGLQKPVPKQQQESVVQPVASNGKPQVAQIPKELRLEIAQNLPFTPNEAKIDETNNTALNNLAIVLQQYPTLTVEIAGYIPSLNNNEPPNLDTQRVIAARNYLLSKGIQSRQVILRSIGKRRPESQGIGNEELPQATAVSFTLTGASETFGLIATRLQSGGANSPALNILQGILPAPEATVPDSNTTATTASVPQQQEIVEIAQSPNTQTINVAIDATINPQSESVLDRVATKLQNNQNLTVEIQGYITASANNVDTSEQEMERVMAVRSYLLDKGIDTNQIIIRSLGERPLPIGEKVAQNTTIDLIFSGDNATTTAQAIDSPAAPSETWQSRAETTKSETTFAQIEIPNIDFNADITITAESETVLDKIATTLQNNPQLKIEIEGLIAAESNDTSDLGRERVLAVRSYLLDKGIDANQIVISSLGEPQPANQKLAQDDHISLALSTAEEIPTAQAPFSEIEDESIFSTELSATSNLIPDLALAPQKNESWLEAIQTNQEEISFAITSESIQIIGMTLPENQIIKAEAELLRLATALNSLLGEDRAAIDMVLRAMRVNQPKVQGVLVDPAMLEKISGESQ